ncbi:MAG: sulfite oxidase heme-binding subunit YedZ [Caldilinea sp.]
MSGRQRRVGESASAATHVREKWFWWTVTLAALAPMGWLAWRALTNSLGVDPVNTINNVSGRAAMITLFLSLACTPLNTIFGFRRALTVRRSLGLIAFAYASLHLLNFVGLDYGFDWNLITQDAVLDKPYILAGGLALLLLALLAITSTRGWMRRLGRNWKLLHQLVYVAGVLVVLHFLWQAKAAERWEPLMYGGVLAALLLVRVPTVRSWLVRQRAARSARVPSPRAVQAD